MERISLATARRIALGAQGFADRRPTGRIDARHIRRVLDRIKLLQLDSVNVLVRSHYLPLFSRIGPYPMELLDDMAYRRRELFECWAHVASLVPIEHYPAIRRRMESTMRHPPPATLEAVYQEVAERGPLSASQLSDPGERRGPWWGWNDGKRALEWLFREGRVTAAARPNFERVYDLTERVIPPEILALPIPEEAEARRRLLLLGAEAHGIGTDRDLCDYFRLSLTKSRPVIRELVADGALIPVEVEGWKEKAYLHPAAKVPRRIDRAALLTPFDPIVWERARAERLFGFFYRIEIYTPAPKRIYGYYVLPFLLGDRLVGRVDLKTDRAARRLLLRGAFLEPGHDPATVAEVLHEELISMAKWLGVDPPSPSEVVWRTVA
ncbi:MAG: winged helix-turn-helix domain-containing protein [Actinomycetota bacterium]